MTRTEIGMLLPPYPPQLKEALSASAVVVVEVGFIALWAHWDLSSARLIAQMTVNERARTLLVGS